MKYLTAFLVLCCSAFASAELVEADLFVESDGLGVYDTETGFTWVNLEMTTNYSIASATASTATGGLFEGFRVASLSEVRAVLDDFFDISSGDIVEFAVPGGAGYVTFKSLFGAPIETREGVDYDSSYAWHLSDDGNAVLLSGARDDWATPTVGDYVLHNGWFNAIAPANTNTSASSAGVWMLIENHNISGVSDVSVPCLGAAAILALLALARRKV